MTTPLEQLTATLQTRSDPPPGARPSSVHTSIVRLAMAGLAILIVLYVLFVLIPMLFPGEPAQVGSVVTPSQTWNIGSPVTAVSVSPDGKTVAVGLGDGNLQIRQITDGRVLWEVLAHGGNVITLVFSRDGRMLASTGEDNVVRLWRTADGAQLHSWSNGTQATHALAFSPNGDLLASTGPQSTTLIFDTANGSLVRTLPGSPRSSGGGMSAVLGLAFRTNGGTLISATDRNMAYTWQMPQGMLSRSQQGESGSIRNETLDVAVSARGDAVAFIDLASQHIYLSRMGSQGNGSVLRDESQNSTDVWSLAISPSGQFVAHGTGVPSSTSHMPSTGMPILIWGVSTGKPVMLLKGHTGNVNSVAWGSDDQYPVSGSQDGTVRLWDLK